MLGSVVQQVDKNLLYQLCIHGQHQYVIRHLHIDIQRGIPFGNMRDRAFNDFFHRFHLLVQHNAAIVQAGQAQYIDHHGMQPVGVLIDIGGKLPGGAIVLQPGLQHFGRPHDAGQRRTEIVRNRPQKRGAVAFLLCFFTRPAMPLRRPEPVHCQRSAFQHRMQQPQLLFIQLFCVCSWDIQHAKHLCAALYRPIIRFPNFYIPQSIFIHTFAQANSVATKTAADRTRGYARNISYIICRGKLPCQIIKGFCLRLTVLRVACVFLCARRQRTCDQRRYGQCRKCDDVIEVVDRKRKIRQHEKIIKKKCGQHRGQYAKSHAPRKPCGQHHREQVYKHNVGILKPCPPEQKTKQ